MAANFNLYNVWLPFLCIFVLEATERIKTISSDQLLKSPSVCQNRKEELALHLLLLALRPRLGVWIGETRLRGEKNIANEIWGKGGLYVQTGDFGKCYYYWHPAAAVFLHLSKLTPPILLLLIMG